jgi:hypothetical protein
MELQAVHHLRRLRLLWLGFFVALVFYALLVLGITPRPALPAQGQPLLWAATFLALLNFVTLMPVYRAMLAGPRRVFAVGHQIAPMLQAHTHAHLVALARVEAVAIFGLLLFFLSGERSWFWVFDGVAAVGMLVLWPRTDKVRALIEPPDQARSPITA